MFFRERKKTTQPTSSAHEGRNRNIPSVISGDMNVNGDFISKGSLEIEGKIEGNITCDTVAVRKNAEVKGNISATNVYLDGKANGMIKGKNILVSPGATVSGVIYYDTLTVKDGAALNAQCKSLSELTAGDGERATASNSDEDDDSGLFEEMTLPSEKADAEEDDAAREAAIASLHKDFEDEAETPLSAGKTEPNLFPVSDDEAPKAETRVAAGA